MTLELFKHNPNSILSSSSSSTDYSHRFGGSFADHGWQIQTDLPCRLVYSLDTDDPLLAGLVPLGGMIPLLYEFEFVLNDGEILYQLDGKQIKVLPNKYEYSRDFDHSNYPTEFKRKEIGFNSIQYDPVAPHSALNYQGVFGLSHLNDRQLKSAVAIAKETWHPEKFDGFDDWSDEDYVRNMGCEPFIQSSPSKRCSNPDCSSPIESEFEGIQFREPSVKTIAVQLADSSNDLMFENAFITLYWQYCSACHCFRANHEAT